MIVIAGLLAIVFGGVIGWAVRDSVIYRRNLTQRWEDLDGYWRSWPAMVKNLRRITKS